MSTPTFKPLSGSRANSLAAIALLFCAFIGFAHRVCADVLTISAGQVFHITWQATDPVGDSAINLYLDDDTDPSSGLVPIATGLASNITSYDWVPDSSLVGKEYYIRAAIVDGGLTVGSYSVRKVHIDGVNSFNVQSPLQTTSPDYAYQYVYNGQVFTGTTTLVPGQNTVTVTATLPNGTTAQHQFNVSLVSSLLSSQGYTYDEMQRIKTYTNGNGIVTTYNYDLAGRLVSTVASNGNAVFYAYDAAGRRTSMADSSGYTFYDYDDLDRLAAVTTSKTSSRTDASALTVAYGYDLASHRTSITYPGGEGIVYTYDNAGRLTGANNVTRGLNTTYEYSPASGLLAAINRANGIRTTYGYDGMGRETDILNQKGGTLLSEYAYTLNPSGNTTSLTVKLPGNVTQTETYAYDELDRLIQVAYADGHQVSYTYDGSGNRLTMTTVQNGVSTVQRFIYGNENRLLKITEGAGALVAQFVYDAAGNRIQKITPHGTTYYNWDERNLLISVITPTDRINYFYNGANQRVGRITNGNPTQFVLDASQGVYQTLQERSGSTITATYTFGADRLSGTISSPAMQLFPLPDRLGSARLISDTNGNAVGEYVFDAFGQTTPTPPTEEFPSFAGEEQDTVTGLVFLRARYYDPAIGVFISSDPAGISSGPNSYAYVGSNPLNIADPDGERGIYIGGSISGSTFIGASKEGGIAFSVNNDDPFNFNKWQLAVVDSVGGGITLPATPGFSDRLEAGIFKGDAGDLSGTSYSGTAGYSKGLPGELGVSGAISEKNVQLQDGTIDYSKALYTLDFGVGTPGKDLSVQRSNTTVTGITGQMVTDYVSSKADELFGFLGLNSDLPSLENSHINFNFGSEVGGVLIDKAANLVGTNLSDIQGATFDPTSNQIVFLGSNNSAAVKDLDLDYFYTAVQAVYGSAVPPFVTLDPPAGAYSQWTDYGNGNGLFEANESGGFVLRYNPIWEGEDTNGGLNVRLLGTDSSNTTPFDFTMHFDCLDATNITASGRHLMRLANPVVTSGAMPAGWSFDSSIYSGTSIGGFSFHLDGQSQDSYYPITFVNNSATNYIINSTFVIPARQHRKYGGRVDGTKLGWVMYEADRVMKCLGVGKDNLTAATYSSTTVNVPGYQNLMERSAGTGNSGGNIRFWFEPNQMNMQRYVDPASGQATIMFSQASVILLTESYLQGLAQSPIAAAFAGHFTTNYDAFATLNFPVLDPTDPTSTHIINVPIFKMLKEGMQAVALARFFRDNNIPLDTWWLNSWQPPTAYSPKSVATATNTSSNGSTFYLLYGGVQISKPNTYTPSATAQGIGQVVASSRPDTTAAPGGDLKEQAWNASTSAGSLTAVASSFQAAQQDASVNLNEVDLNFASPGALPLRFTRYYQSGYMAHQAFGPGWRYTRYALQFSRPSWYDEQGLMTDASGNTLPKDTSADTHLRSDALRLVDLSTGSVLDFTSSMKVAYAINGLGNPTIAVSGLTASDVPTFTAGQRQNGTTLVQTPGNAYQYQATTPDGAMLFFDAQGRLLQTVDHNGYQQFYDYDPNANLIDIKDNAGQMLTVNYNTDGTGTIKSVTGPANEEIDYAYDTSGRLASATHKRSGASTSYTYNTSNQLVDTTHFDGIKPVVTTADLKGRSSLRDDYRGNTSSFSFYKNAATGLRSSTVSISGSSLAPTERDSDAMDRVASVKDPLNNWTLYGYSGTSLYPNSVQLPTLGRPAIQIQRNSIGQPTQVTDAAVPGAQPVQLAYNTANLPYWQKDAVGRQTMLQYTSGTNNLSQVTRYLGSQSVTTNLGYQNGYVKTLADPLNHTTTYNRDGVGRVTSVVDPTGITLGYEYDSLGRVSKVKDPRMSSPMIYSYDNFDRVTDIAMPAGTIHYDYDPATHRLSKVTDLQGRTTRYVYSATGDLLQTINDTSTGALTTQYAYSRFGALNQVTPPGASAINFITDDLGRVLGSSESNGAPLGAPKALSADHAIDGVVTDQHDFTFVWGAPDSDVGVIGYSFALDNAPADAVNTTQATATIHGVPNGRHTFNVKAQDKSGQWGAIATFNLWVDSRFIFEKWLAQHFTPQQLADPSITGEAADPDNDKIPNLAEFALGTDPQVADVSQMPTLLSVTVGETEYPTIQYRHRIADSAIVYVVETSPDLLTWTPVDTTLNQVGSAIPLAGGEFELLTVRGSEPLKEGAFQSYIRLRITHP